MELFVTLRILIFSFKSRGARRRRNGGAERQRGAASGGEEDGGGERHAAARDGWAIDSSASCVNCGGSFSF